MPTMRWSIGATILLLAAILIRRADGQTCAQYDQVQIQLKWLQQAQFTGYLVAVDQGFYTEECLDVAIRPGGANINMELEVVQNRAQFGIDWMAGLLVQREAGLDVQIISQVFTRAAAVEIAFAKKNIRTPTDFKGKNVCVWMGGNELSLRALFDQSGLRWDNDTSFNQSPGSDANCISQAFTETDFLSGRCDAAAAMRYNELALILETTNPATNALYTIDDLHVFDYADYNITTFEDAIFVSKAWLALPGNRDLTLRFLRATIKGWLWGRDFPQLVNQKLFSRNFHQDWELNEVNRIVFPNWPGGFGVAPIEEMQASADRVYTYGILDRPPNATDFYRSDLALEAYLGYTGQLSSVAQTKGWSSSPATADADAILGSHDVIGASYQPRGLRFCLQAGELTTCEGVRRPSTDDALADGSGAAIALQLLAAIALGVIAAIATALVYYRNERVIISASLPFCLTICFGAMIFLSAIFLSIGTLSTGQCHARVWLMATGFCVMMGSFLIKVRRIDQIFSNKSMITKKLPNELLAKQLAMLLLVELLLLALFSGLSDFTSETFDDIDNGRLYHTLCRIHHSTAGSAMTGLIFGWNGLLLLWCIVLAYRTRDVVDAYNEAGLLALAAYNMSLIVIVVVPISFFLGVSPQVQLIIADVGILVGVMLSMLLLFAPKLYAAATYGSRSNQPADAPTVNTSAMSPSMALQHQRKLSQQGGVRGKPIGGGGGKPPPDNMFNFCNLVGSSQDQSAPRNGVGHANGNLARSSPGAGGGAGQRGSTVHSPFQVASSVAGWSRGHDKANSGMSATANVLKSLSKDVLLYHLKTFLLGERSVREELRTRGVPQDEIDRALAVELQPMITGADKEETAGSASSPRRLAAPGQQSEQAGSGTTVGSGASLTGGGGGGGSSTPLDVTGVSGGGRRQPLKLHFPSEHSVSAGHLQQCAIDMTSTSPTAAAGSGTLTARGSTTDLQALLPTSGTQTNPASPRETPTAGPWCAALPPAAFVAPANSGAGSSRPSSPVGDAGGAATSTPSSSRKIRIHFPPNLQL